MKNLESRAKSKESRQDSKRKEKNWIAETSCLITQNARKA